MELKIPPPVVALISAAIMWAVAEFSAPALPVLEVPGLLPLVVLVVGLAVEISAVVLFLGADTTVNPMNPGNTVQLVNRGIYRFSRNPMYLGVLLVLSSWALWLGNAVNLAVLLLFICYITRFQIIPEERVLAELFPDEFDAYRIQVRRWI
ncbi:MAG TPA: isoprenylcysteine carboxylmethyltransferase family protein [Gammaproteobacteria bacterium]|nr:isoprenylcysteine carboxylmethyltransferase family protein [Gammaproteobacteria bacterium]